MSSQRALEVMYTVDVEAWPRCPNWQAETLAGDLARDIYGETPDGRFGIGYQAELLREHGLKGVFFVEALFACEVGIEPLAKIVETVQEAGSEIQLHIHTEWFEKMTTPIVDQEAYNIRELSYENQVLVIERALENLRAAGAENVIAYRAGNFGADFQTLKALAECGIQYDSSYNFDYLDKGCGLGLPEMLVQPTPLEGVIEYPVTCFRDYPGHYRPAQLTAISASEMRSALSEAYEANYQSFVIVSHSFELMRDRKMPLPYGQPDWSVIGRFEALCKFLSQSPSRFKTVGFSDLEEFVERPPAPPLHPPAVRTAARTASRVFSQAIRRLPRQQELMVRQLLQRAGMRNL
jgi:peptidoglycan/xylan/chitin deacetylase (PgdA/CDA1 family)